VDHLMLIARMNGHSTDSIICSLTIAVYNGTASMLSMIKGRRVAALLSLTIKRNPSFVSGQYPPNNPPLRHEVASIIFTFGHEDHLFGPPRPGPPILIALELNFHEEPLLSLNSFVL
ncbi:Putative LOC101846883, partial [Caligus rogercresseyi]